MPRFHGYDLSTNHGAVVELGDDGKPAWYGYVTDVQKAVRKGALGCGHHLPVAKMKKASGRDPDYLHVARLQFWGQLLDHWFQIRRPDFVAIEEFAFGSRTRGQHDIAAISGIARYLALTSGSKLRLHNPMDVKLFSAHEGDPEPEQMIGAVVERWWPGLDEVVAVVKGLTQAGVNTVLGDLADACCLARMAWTEDLLRKGVIKMRDLAEAEIRAFNRATMARPVSVLGREWLVADDRWMPRQT